MLPGHADVVSIIKELCHRFPTFYDYLTLHIVPGPRSYTYFLPVLAIFLSLSLPSSLLPFPILRWVILPSLLLLEIHLWHARQSFSVISINNALMGFMLLGWYDVRRDFKYISWSSANINTSQPIFEDYPAKSARGRMKWAATLLISLQLKDFLIGDKGHDRKQLRSPPSRGGYGKFARRMVRQTIFVYILLDTTSWLINDSPYLAFRGIANPSLSPRGVIEHILQALCMMTHLGAALALYTGYLPLALLTVALWPFPHLRYNPFLSPYMATPHFGSIFSIWSPPSSSHTRTWGLRAFWGTFWHQNLRYYSSTPGIALSHLLGLKRNSMLRYMIITSGAFAFSGMVHAGMVPPHPVKTDWSALELRMTIAGFFLLQVPGIACEALIDALSTSSPSTTGRDKKDQGGNGKVGDKEKRQWSVIKQVAAAGWFIAWFAGTMYVTVRPVGRELGWWSMPAVPVSVVRWLVGQPQWWESISWSDVLATIRKTP